MLAGGGIVNEEQYADIKGALAANEKEHESYNRRLHDHDEHLTKLDQTYIMLERLTNSVNSLTTSMGDMKTTLQSVDKRVSEIEKEPADKWKKLTWKIVELVVAAVVGATLAVFIKG